MTDRTPDALLTEAMARIAPDVDLSTARPDEPLAEQFDLDSMDMLGVMEALQQLSGVEIPERDAPKLATLSGALSYLSARLAL
jgi:acyl carrier protein